MDEGVAPWTWDEADIDEEFPCRQLDDAGRTAPVSAADLAGLGVRGLQFRSWDRHASGWLNTDAVGLRCGGVRTETGRGRPRRTRQWRLSNRFWESRSRFFSRVHALCTPPPVQGPGAHGDQ